MRWIVPLLIALLTVALLTAPRALQAMGDFLVAGDPLRPSDAAIAISGDGRERVRTASALVTEGDARWLILSGAPPGQRGAAAELVRYAREYQIADARMLVDASATSTVENAYGSARVMRTHGLRTAIVVTSPYHMRRTIIVFRAIFQPQGLAVRAFPARDSFFEVREWWTRRRDRELVLREYAKLAGYLMGFR